MKCCQRGRGQESGALAYCALSSVVRLSRRSNRVAAFGAYRGLPSFAIMLLIAARTEALILVFVGLGLAVGSQA